MATTPGTRLSRDLEAAIASLDSHTQALIYDAEGAFRAPPTPALLRRDPAALFSMDTPAGAPAWGRDSYDHQTGYDFRAAASHPHAHTQTHTRAPEGGESGHYADDAHVGGAVDPHTHGYVHTRTQSHVRAHAPAHSPAPTQRGPSSMKSATRAINGLLSQAQRHMTSLHAPAASGGTSAHADTSTYTHFQPQPPAGALAASFVPARSQPLHDSAAARATQAGMDDTVRRRLDTVWEDALSHTHAHSHEYVDNVAATRHDVASSHVHADTSENRGWNMTAPSGHADVSAAALRELWQDVHRLQGDLGGNLAGAVSAGHVGAGNFSKAVSRSGIAGAETGYDMAPSAAALGSTLTAAFHDNVNDATGPYAHLSARYDPPTEGTIALTPGAVANFASRLEDLKQRMSAVELQHVVERAALQREVGDAQAAADAVRSEVTATWIGKWKEREMHWQNIVAGLRTRVAELEDAVQALGVDPQRPNFPRMLGPHALSESGAQGAFAAMSRTELERLVDALQAALNESSRERQSLVDKCQVLESQVTDLLDERRAVAAGRSRAGSIPAALSDMGTPLRPSDSRQEPADELRAAQATMLGFKQAAQELAEDSERLRSEKAAAEREALQQTTEVSVLRDIVARLQADAEVLRRELNAERGDETKLLLQTRQARATADDMATDLMTMQAEVARSLRYVEMVAASVNVHLTHASGADHASPADYDQSTAPLRSSGHRGESAHQLQEAVRALVDALTARAQHADQSLAVSRKQMARLADVAREEIRRLRGALAHVLGSSELESIFASSSRFSADSFAVSLMELPDVLQRLATDAPQAPAAAPRGAEARSDNAQASATIHHLQQSLVAAEARIAELQAALRSAEQRAVAANPITPAVIPHAHGPQPGGSFSASVADVFDPITPADLAVAVARARADERAAVLKETQVAAATAREVAAQVGSRGAGTSRRSPARTGSTTASGLAADRLTVVIEELAASQAEALSATRTSSRLQDELDTLRNRWREQRQVAEQRIASMQQQLQTASNEVISLRQQLAATHAELAEAMGQVERLMGDKSAVTSAMADAQAQAQREHTALRSAIADLQRDLVAARHELGKQQNLLEYERLAAAQEVEQTRQLTAHDTEANLRQALDRERSEAVDHAMAMADERAAAALQERLARQHAELELQFADQMARLRSEHEEDIRKTTSHLRNAHQAAMDEALRVAREEERATAAARVAAVQEAADAQLRAMEARIAQMKELARRELTRRRQIHSRIMDLQGNIRVHVRIRPTQAQIASMRAGTGAALLTDVVLDEEQITRADVPSALEATQIGKPKGAAGAFGTPLSPLAQEVAARARASSMGAASLPEDFPEYVQPTVESLGEGQLVVRAPFGFVSLPIGKPSAGSPFLASGRGLAASGVGGRGDNRRSLFEFEFDEVHGAGASQEGIFEYVRPMVDHALAGFNMCVFAYGQTGSGKTFSMEGEPSRPGITIRTLRHMFAAAEVRANEPAEVGVEGYSFALSMFEVYNERVRDLLGGVTEEHIAAMPNKLSSSAAAARPARDAGKSSTLRALEAEIQRIGIGGTDGHWASRLRGAPPAPALGSEHDNLPVRETTRGIEIQGLTVVAIHDVAQAVEAIRIGTINRAVGAHSLNEHSSRSHMVVRIWVEGPSREDDSRVVSVINLVDLAGSERVRRTGAEGERMKEAQAINSSLSILGSVIGGLKKGNGHVPYRDSKLTFVLKDSLSGTAKVMMLACVSGDDDDVAETICTLNFAQRCRHTALGAPERNVIAKGTLPNAQASDLATNARASSTTRGRASSGTRATSPAPRSMSRVSNGGAKSATPARGAAHASPTPGRADMRIADLSEIEAELEEASALATPTLTSSGDGVRRATSPHPSSNVTRAASATRQSLPQQRAATNSMLARARRIGTALTGR